jgi:hypothetical protein
MSYLWYLLGLSEYYEDEDEKKNIEWCSEQRQKKYYVLKDINKHIYLLQNHICSDICICDKRYKVVQRIGKKKKRSKK